MRRLRLRRLRRRLPPPDLLPLPSRALVCAGAICVNLAILFASCVVEPRLPYEPYDAAPALEGH